MAAYVRGASTRDIGEITEALVGEHVGRSTVSRVTKSLNEKVEELRTAPITEGCMKQTRSFTVSPIYTQFGT